MKDLTNMQNQNNTHPKFENPSPESMFEEELKRQNIRTMLEIYGEEYFAKIETLTQ